MSGNPFEDEQEERGLLADNTLRIGGGITLTLGEDSLTILDEDREATDTLCCGLLPARHAHPTRTIPYYNILRAELLPLELLIHYAKPISARKPSKGVRPDILTYSLPSKRATINANNNNSIQSWIDQLTTKAYSNNRAKQAKRLKILLNPFSGQGYALKVYRTQVAPLLSAANRQIDVEETRYVGHARDIAQELDISKYDAVVCVSGDGLPHEVFNGFGTRSDARTALKEVAVAQIPGGSGNAMAWNCFGTDSASLVALGIIKGIRMPLDLTSITQADPASAGGVKRTLSFCSQSVGMVAEVDLGTENMRALGDLRFTVGFLQRIVGKMVWPCEIALALEDDSKESIQKKYRDFRASGGNAAETQTYQATLDSMDNDEEDLVTTTSNNQQNPATTPATTTDPSQSTSTTLPPLTLGTVTSPLPATFTPLTTRPALSTFYAGNLTHMAASAPFFACAQPSDGCLDLMTMNGNISRLKALGSLLAIEGPDGGLFAREDVGYQKIRGYRLIPYGKGGWARGRSVDGGGEARFRDAPEDASPDRRRGDVEIRDGKMSHDTSSRTEHDEFISIDGERIPFAPFQAEVHRGLGMTLSRTGWRYESMEF
jgi:sphingosine kinase